MTQDWGLLAELVPLSRINQPEPLFQSLQCRSHHNTTSPPFPSSSASHIRSAFALAQIYTKFVGKETDSNGEESVTTSLVQDRLKDKQAGRRRKLNDQRAQKKNIRLKNSKFLTDLFVLCSCITVEVPAHSNTSGASLNCFINTVHLHSFCISIQEIYGAVLVLTVICCVLAQCKAYKGSGRTGMEYPLWFQNFLFLVHNIAMNFNQLLLPLPVSTATDVSVFSCLGRSSSACCCVTFKPWGRRSVCLS